VIAEVGRGYAIIGLKYASLILSFSVVMANLRPEQLVFRSFFGERFEDPVEQGRAK